MGSSVQQGFGVKLFLFNSETSEGTPHLPNELIPEVVRGEIATISKVVSQREKQDFPDTLLDSSPFKDSCTLG